MKTRRKKRKEEGRNKRGGDQKTRGRGKGEGKAGDTTRENARQDKGEGRPSMLGDIPFST